MRPKPGSVFDFINAEIKFVFIGILLLGQVLQKECIGSVPSPDEPS